MVMRLVYVIEITFYGMLMSIIFIMAGVSVSVGVGLAVAHASSLSIMPTFLTSLTSLCMVDFNRIISPWLPWQTGPLPKSCAGRGPDGTDMTDLIGCQHAYTLS